MDDLRLPQIRGQALSMDVFFLDFNRLGVLEGPGLKRLV
jgi:hypothetical protein